MGSVDVNYRVAGSLVSKWQSSPLMEWKTAAGLAVSILRMYRRRPKWTPLCERIGGMLPSLLLGTNQSSRGDSV
jgi:hypothetical protein